MWYISFFFIFIVSEHRKFLTPIPFFYVLCVNNTLVLVLPENELRFFLLLVSFARRFQVWPSCHISCSFCSLFTHFLIDSQNGTFIYWINRSMFLIVRLRWWQKSFEHKNNIKRSQRVIRCLYESFYLIYILHSTEPIICIKWWCWWWRQDDQVKRERAHTRERIPRENMDKYWPV